MDIAIIFYNELLWHD